MTDEERYLLMLSPDERAHWYALFGEPAPGRQAAVVVAPVWREQAQDERIYKPYRKRRQHAAA